MKCVMRADCSPTKVFANAVASPRSPLTVEVLDEQFRPFPVYSGDDCVPLVEDGFRQPVVWKSGHALPSAGASFRLQINYGGGVRPEDARLYALYVADDS